MRAWLAGFLLVGLALAGCIGGEDPVDDQAGAETDPNNDEQTDPNGQGPPQNSSDSAPIPSLTADLDGGAAPLTINFTLDAADPDGDTLSWELDLTGDGTPDVDGVGNLPQVVTHTFEEVGNFTVTFTVFDAQSSANATHLVQVVAPPAAEAPEPITFTGSIISPDPFAFEGLCLMPLLDFPGTGTFGQSFSAPPGIAGWSFSMDDPSAVAMFLAGDTPSGGGNSGTIGNGITRILTCSTMPMVDYTLTITPP